MKRKANGWRRADLPGLVTEPHASAVRREMRCWNVGRSRQGIDPKQIRRFRNRPVSMNRLTSMFLICSLISSAYLTWLRNSAT